MSDNRQVIIDFANDYLGEYEIKGDDRDEKIIPTICPLCHGGSSGKDKRTFALFISNGMYVCKRGSCGRHGKFEELVKELSGKEIHINRSVFPKKSEKQFNMPSVKVFDPTEDIYKYFELRKISRATVDALKIGSDVEGNIVFRFYWNGEDVYHKFRVPRKQKPEEAKRKEWQESGTKAILYNMDNVVFNEPLILTEGEIDCASLYEAGLTNVVSVPCGVDNNDWITYCYDWLEKFHTIIIFGDNDAAGRRGVENWTKKLGDYRCLVVRDYPQIPGTNPPQYCKDANEILYRFGESVLLEMVESADEVETRGLLRLADVVPVDPTTIPRIRTMIPALDDAIGGLVEGGISVLTGASGNGKSTFANQILLAAIEQGYTVCAYSGELNKENFQMWCNLQAASSEYIGLRFDPIRNKMVPFVPMEVQHRIMQWYAPKFYLYNNEEVFVDIKQADSIVNVFTMCARKNGAKLFLCDNLLTTTADSDDEWRAQAVFVNSMKKFAVHYQAHVIIVAHPKKQKQGESIDKASVSGSSAIVNLADNAIVVQRPDLRIIKNRTTGIQRDIPCAFCGDSRRIYQADVGDKLYCSWDRTGLKHPDPRADSMPEYGIQLSQLDRQPF